MADSVFKESVSPEDLAQRTSYMSRIAGHFGQQGFSDFARFHEEAFNAEATGIIRPGVNNPQAAQRITRGVQEFNNVAVGGTELMAQRVIALLKATPEDIEGLQVPETMKTALDQAHAFLKKKPGVGEKDILRLLQDGKMGPVSRLAAQIASDHQAQVGDDAKGAKSVFQHWADKISKSYAGDQAAPEQAVSKDNHLQPGAIPAIQADLKKEAAGAKTAPPSAPTAETGAATQPPAAGDPVAPASPPKSSLPTLTGKLQELGFSN